MIITILQGAFLPIPPKLGGAVEKMWFLLGQEFVVQGSKVTHISRRWEGLPIADIINGVNHLRVSGFDTPSNGLYLKLLDLIYTLKAVWLVPKDTDVVVTNTFWAPILLRIFYKSKIVVDVARMPKGQMRFYYKSTLRANSTPVASAIKSELPLRRHKHVLLIPNPLPYRVNRNVDLVDKKCVVLYCGRIHQEKGLELLLDLARNLPQNWILKIVGPSAIAAGGGGESYFNYLKHMFLITNTEFMQPVYDIEALNQLYQEAAIFVYPSVAEKGETFGMAPLEAMAWGCVPVVSDLACFKDFIADGQNGLVFNHRASDASLQAKNAVMSLIDSDDLRIRLGRSALNVRFTHSVEHIAKLFLNEFENL